MVTKYMYKQTFVFLTILPILPIPSFNSEPLCATFSNLAAPVVSSLFPHNPQHHYLGINASEKYAFDK